MTPLGHHWTSQCPGTCRPEATYKNTVEILASIAKILSNIHIPVVWNIRYIMHLQLTVISQIARFMGPTWGPPGSCRPQMGPMLAPWTLLSGIFLKHHDMGYSSSVHLYRRSDNSCLFKIICQIPQITFIFYRCNTYTYTYAYAYAYTYI